MRILKSCAFASALAVCLTSGAALAADMPMPAPVPEAPPPVIGGNWYLRGDVGFSNQTVGKLDNALYSGASNLQHADKGFDAAPLAGVGVGYKFNDWIRVDATTEYRGSANFHGLDTFQFVDSNTGDLRNAEDQYSASKTEWTSLLNAYLDLGTWYGITPYVGAGVGASYNTIKNFQDAGLSVDTVTGDSFPSLAYGRSKSSWNLAWALHAGVAYQVTPNLALDLSYRYIDLGKAQSGDLIAYDGTNTVNNPMKFKHVASNDIRLGLRWTLDAPDSTEVPPLYAQPAPYAPQPAPYVAPAPHRCHTVCQ